MRHISPREFVGLFSGPKSAIATPAPADPIGDALRADIPMSIAYVNGQWTDPAGGRTWTSIGAESIPSVSTNYGDAASLNGTDQYLQTSGDTSDITISDADFTLIVYAKPHSFVANPNLAAFLVMKDNANGDDEYYLAICANSIIQPHASHSFYFLVDGADGGLDVFGDAFGSAQLNQDHLVFAWYTAADNLVHIQVNNGTINTSDWSMEVAAVPQPTKLDIGVDSYGGSFPPDTFYDGDVIVHFLTRLLTADEKDYLWNDGAGRSLY